MPILEMIFKIISAETFVLYIADGRITADIKIKTTRANGRNSKLLLFFMADINEMIIKRKAGVVEYIIFLGKKM